jgi:hypothetical protein
MKLYNLFEQVIFEEVIRKIQLNEAVSSSEIDSVIQGDPEVSGKFYYVSFDYADKDGTTSNRWVKIHQKNLSTAGNTLIDAKQISKNGLETETVIDKDGNQITQSVEGWRKFNIAKMSNFKVSKVPFQQPEPGFNPIGNNSITVAHTDPDDIVKFTYGYKDSKYAQKVADATKAKQDEFIKNREEEKLKRQQQRQEKTPRPAIPTTAPAQAPKPNVRTTNQVPVAEPIVKTTNGITNKPEIEPSSNDEEEENLNVR